MFVRAPLKKLLRKTICIFHILGTSGSHNMVCEGIIVQVRILRILINAKA
jgi:hypothetical protein